MNRRGMIALGLAVAAAPVFAGDEALGPEVDIQLTAVQLTDLLTGNTITGTWSGSNYTQFFAENGNTVYIPEGRQPDIGKWRTNFESNQYESWWEQTGWSTYTVMMTNDGYAWVSSHGLQPFKVYEGKQITW